MERGAALLGLVAGGTAMAVLVRPGETPESMWPRGAPVCESGRSIAAYFREVWQENGAPPLVGAAVAGEGSEARGRLALAGLGVTLEAAQLRRALNTSRIHLMGAAQAFALGAPRLGAGDRQAVCEGQAQPNGAIGVVAPVTTLAASVALKGPDGEWLAAPSEGPRLGVRPFGAREEAAVAALAAAGRRTAEHILCASGLCALEDALARLDGAEPYGDSTPDAVPGRARAGDARAQEAVRIFSGWLGSFSRQTCLMLAASGGVYLAGMLIQTMADVFDAELFGERFRRPDSGDGYTDALPVWRAGRSMTLVGLSTLFSASDARVDARGVLLLDC